MPPLHSTAASGTLPTEQTKLSTAITGPMNAPQIVCHQRWGVLQEQPVEDVVAQLGHVPRQQEPDEDLLVEHLPVAAEVVRDVRPRRRRRRAGRATAAARRPSGAGGRCRPPGRARAPAPPGAGRRTAGPTAIRTIITIPPRYSASANCSRSAPTAPTPLPDEVGRGELEGQRRRGRGALGTGSWRSPMAASSTTTTPRPDPSPWPPAERRRLTGALDALAQDPRLHDRRSRSRTPAPTRPAGHQEHVFEDGPGSRPGASVIGSARCAAPISRTCHNPSSRGQFPTTPTPCSSRPGHL